jgi:hypothetical protein
MKYATIKLLGSSWRSPPLFTIWYGERVRQEGYLDPDAVLQDSGYATREVALLFIVIAVTGLRMVSFVRSPWRLSTTARV